MEFDRGGILKKILVLFLFLITGLFAQYVEKVEEVGSLPSNPTALRKYVYQGNIYVFADGKWNIVGDQQNETYAVSSFGGGTPIDTNALHYEKLAAKQDLLGFTPVNTNDSRLSDARTPTAHNQAISTVTALPDSLNNKNTRSEITTLLGTKQNTLISGTNIKTINGNTLLGSGDMVVGGGSSPTGVLADEQFSILQADGTLNAASGVQVWAGTNGTAQDIFTVVANSTYRFEGRYYINTGATTHTTALAFALTTATVASFEYQVILWSAAANTISTTQSTTHVSGVASKVINATSTAVYTIIQFEGTFVTGTGGTITPQINFSANPTGTNLMKRSSFVSIRLIGINTVTKAGGWN